MTDELHVVPEDLIAGAASIQAATSDLDGNDGFTAASTNMPESASAQVLSGIDAIASSVRDRTKSTLSTFAGAISQAEIEYSGQDDGIAVDMSDIARSIPKTYEA